MRQKHLPTAIIIIFIMNILLAGCYHNRTFTTRPLPDTIQYSEKQRDSLIFAHTHHYSQNFNFIIKADSLILLKEQPEEFLSGLPTDTLHMKKGDRVAVADIRTSHRFR